MISLCVGSLINLIRDLRAWSFHIYCALVLDKTDLVNYKFSIFSSCCLLILWLLVVAVTTYLITFNPTFFLLNALNNLGILIGIMSVWSLYDHVSPERITKYSVLFGYSFFIFVFHEPLLTILKKGMFFWLGKTTFTSLLIYIGAPLIAIGISILIRYDLKRS